MVEFTTVDELWKTWTDYVCPRFPFRLFKVAPVAQQRITFVTLVISAVAVINIAAFVFTTVEATRAIQGKPTKISVDREAITPVGMCSQRFIYAW